MKRQLAVLLLAASFAAPGGAGASAASPSPLALESPDLAAPSPPSGEVSAADLLASEEFARAPADEFAYRHRRVYERVRYRPRRRIYREPRSSSRPESFTQVHLGFMDPEGSERAGFLGGIRVGVAPDPHVQIGGQIDWRHRGNSDTEVISEEPGPGGTTIITRRDLARSSTDWVPIMAFLQISGHSGLPLVPYVGAGAGYQILHISADNFATGEEFEGTFDGFGWQLWGGVGVPLSGAARFNSEVFLNQAELSRDVDDLFTGEEFRETVDMDGVGMRFGISWGF